MFVDFERLGPAARLWVYQADRLLTKDEKSTIDEQMQDFCRTWKAHGRDLRSSAAVLHDVFLIVGVDETQNPVSGCSIDASVAAIRELGARLSIDFFDRLQVAYMNGGEVCVLKKGQIPGAIASGILEKETPVFSNTIAKAEDLATKWLMPAGSTWLSRLFTSAEKMTQPDTTK